MEYTILCTFLFTSTLQYTPSTHSCQWSRIPTSLWWTRKRGLLVETSELASRLILLIQISSHGNCCIDWTTKAWRKTLQHSIIHTDRHNAILLLPLFLPPPSPSPFPCLSLSPYPYFFTGRISVVGGGEQTNKQVCVCALSDCDPISSESGGVFGCFLGGVSSFSPSCLSVSFTIYSNFHCLFISTFTDVISNVQGKLC